MITPSLLSNGNSRAVIEDVQPQVDGGIQGIGRHTVIFPDGLQCCEHCPRTSGPRYDLVANRLPPACAALRYRD